MSDVWVEIKLYNALVLENFKLESRSSQLGICLLHRHLNLSKLVLSMADHGENPNFRHMAPPSFTNWSRQLPNFLPWPTFDNTDPNRGF
ncbi:hypothetical protein TSUD_324270 [Trifolium subterraneum]|uniref:Uncharacterized protein n=1 Tax=Trifolium subterraneum TaxID=3900 RepID=A0A2Z6M5T8_TRISU|nr:hypothetical protein TSUD_324270 [Trifolium subterraneum]